MQLGEVIEVIEVEPAPIDLPETEAPPQVAEPERVEAPVPS
jgi:hypothetical protein